ncbi:hypothetical protein [Oryzihumus leptocrescens]|uniref:PH (Pleckstrin Homology) domain-containing protein n=1 Tax=Oryzihumus leptocrescens TaxID=297536 RepID=A0A542Z9C0_9MICO|nr:hypothetical protein FB474_3716 [Oryzihumus leptocrescens]
MPTPEPTTCPLRWPVALTRSFLAPGLGGVVVAVLVDPWPVGLLLGLALAASFGSLALARARRRSLTVSTDGLLLQRHDDALEAGWEEVTGIRRRRLGGLLPVEELTLRDSGTVPVSLYDKAWRDGPIGAQLRAGGIL